MSKISPELAEKALELRIARLRERIANAQAHVLRQEARVAAKMPAFLKAQAAAAKLARKPRAPKAAKPAMAVSPVSPEAPNAA